MFVSMSYLFYARSCVTHCPPYLTAFSFLHKLFPLQKFKLEFERFSQIEDTFLFTIKCHLISFLSCSTSCIPLFKMNISFSSQNSITFVHISSSNSEFIRKNNKRKYKDDISWSNAAEYGLRTELVQHSACRGAHIVPGALQVIIDKVSAPKGVPKKEKK
jgi:hypothetical protein